MIPTTGPRILFWRRLGSFQVQNSLSWAVIVTSPTFFLLFHHYVDTIVLACYGIASLTGMTSTFDNTPLQLLVPPSFPRYQIFVTFDLTSHEQDIGTARRFSICVVVVFHT